MTWLYLFVKIIYFVNFSLISSLCTSPPFSRVALVEEACVAVQTIRSFLGQPCQASSGGCGEGSGLMEEVKGQTEGLDLLDLNYALYRCDQEERDDGNGGGAYEVPGAGSLVYCGLQGIVSMLSKVGVVNLHDIYVGMVFKCFDKMWFLALTETDCIFSCM